MKKIAVLLVLAFSMLLVYGNVTDEPTAANNKKIEGQVIDSRTGEALAGVALNLNGSKDKIYSDLNGKFTIENLAPGTYDIEIAYVSYKKLTLKEIEISSSEVSLKVELESASAR